MKNPLSATILVLAASLLAPVPVAADQAALRREAPLVVIVNSYHNGFAWSDEELSGFLARLRETYPTIDPAVEYMDMKRWPGAEDERRVKDYLVAKYRGLRPDVVIALDNPALEMLLRYHTELFPGAPIVFAGISDAQSIPVPSGVEVTGVEENTDLPGTLRLAFTLHPNARHVLLMCDTTVTGKAVQHEVAPRIPAFSSHASFEFLPASTWEEAALRIASLPRDSFLVILSYATDRAGVTRPLAESTRFVTASSPVPVYSLHATRLGYGIVGGMLLVGTEHGRKAGDLAVRVLSGERASSIPVETHSTSRPFFDYRALARFHIPVSLLPPGSRIVSRPATVFSQYPVFSGVMTGLVALLVMLASLLAANIFRLREAERGLTRSQANLSALIESAEDFICSQDRDGAVLAFNSAFARLFRVVTGADLKPGMRYLDLLPPEFRDVYEALSRQTWEEGRALGVHTLDVGGEKLSLEISLFPIRSGNEMIGLMGSGRDITERVRAERALRESEEKLLQARKMEAVGRLAGGITHDFNNHLTVIKAYADMAVDGQACGADVREELREIQLAVRRAAALTTQLLAFSRKQVLQPRVFNLTAMIGDMTRMLARLIGEDIELATTLAPGLWSIRADPAQIQQVIMNLVLNARDAMPGGGRLSIITENAAAAARETAAPEADAVVLTISDTGRGMDKETLSHIFEPFFTTKEEGRGTGLGLSTVYGVVQQSGGTITCGSAPGQGTHFRISFPRVEAQPEEPREAVAREGAAQGSGTILIAEDEAAVRSFLRATLTRAGYVVREAIDGAEAIDILATSRVPIDLIVSDVVMPRVGGHELLVRARAMSPRLKILFISGYIGEEVAKRGEIDERVRVLRKPFGPNELLAEVKAILEAT